MLGFPLLACPRIDVRLHSALAPHFQILTAPTPEEALACALQSKPSIALIPLDAAQFDGFLLCETLRSQPALAECKIFLLSNILLSPEDEAYARQCGAGHILPESLDPGKLAKFLRAEVDRPEVNSNHHRVEAFEEVGQLRKMQVRLLNQCSQMQENVLAMKRQVEVEKDERGRMQAQLARLERLAALASTACGAAHDLNNILCGIIGLAEKGHSIPGTPSDSLRKFEEIIHASGRASHLVRSILASNQQPELSLGPVDLGKAMNGVLEILRVTLPSAIELSSNQEANLPQILGEETQFQNLLTNLVINAWHAIGDKEGKIVTSLRLFIPTEEHRRRLPALPERPLVQIQVIDTGKGIPAESLPHIFESFFTTKPRGQGTGLGLYVGALTVRAWGGWITVDSTVGKGTTFTMYFPPTHAMEAQPTPRSTTIPQGQGQRILFVDDEKLVGEVMGESLAALGYKPSVALTAEDALEQVRAGRFDAVITDLTMPKMDGIDLARELHALYPQMPIILTTGHAGKFSEQHVKSLGFAGLLLKPFNAEALALMLTKALV